MSVTVKPGTVMRYNNKTGVGFIHFLDDTGISFKSVDFAGSIPRRFPEVGDEVKVIMNGPALVLVRLVDDC